MSAKSAVSVVAEFTPATAAAAYESATGAAKSNVRRDATTAMHAAVMASDLDAAKSWMAAIAGMVAKSAAPVTVDYAAKVAARVIALRAAADLIESGDVTPGGVPADAAPPADEIASAVAAFVADDSTADAARLIASDRVARSADRRDIGAAIVRAFEASGADRMTIAEVSRLGADGDYTPGSGAIAARMFGGRGVDGFRAVESTPDSPRSIARA